MKKIILLFIPLLFLSIGCTQYIELDQLDVVENLGIDWKDNQFQLTATTIEKKEAEYIYQNFTGYGQTIEEAVENIKSQETKKLYIAHLDLLILTPTIIEKHLEEVLNFFLQNSESRNDFSMAISNSIDFLTINEQTQQIKEMIQIAEKDMGTTKSIEFEEFLKDLLEQNFSYLPTIEKNETIKVNSITLVQNHKILEHLTEEECILYNLLTNHIQKATIYQSTILSSQTTTRFQKEKMKITLDMTLSKENPTFAKQLEKKTKSMFEKFKEQNIDIFQFQKQVEISNNRFYTKYKKDLLNHMELEFQIKIKTNIQENKEVNLS